MNDPNDGMTLELEPLCTATLHVSTMIVAGKGNFGLRGIGELADSRLEGERLNATQFGAAAGDWALVTDDGFVRGDIRIAWRTDDGAALYMTYIAFMEDGVSYASVEFETGDDRYSWLNRKRVVGKGGFDADAGIVTYRFYVLK